MICSFWPGERPVTQGGTCRQALVWMAVAVSLAVGGQASAQISKATQILTNRGFQVQGMVTKDDVFHLHTYCNPNFTAVNWLWDSNPSQMGAAPGFPWARWANSETVVPPQGTESSYMSQLVMLQLGDEWTLTDTNTRTRLVNWFNSVRSSFPNTILFHNNYGGQVPDDSLGDFIARAQPDMLSFDSYPWQADFNTGVPFDGPPSNWYGDLRRYRQWAMNVGIPFATYMQTFHAKDSVNYRDPSASELRLNNSAAMAFNAKVLIDFTYNTGASSLFVSGLGGDNVPTPLYAERADAALRARNLGKALVRLKPVADLPGDYTTSIMFLRGKYISGGVTNFSPVPNSFLNDPSSSPNPGTPGTIAYTWWEFGDNDPYLSGWSVTNKADVHNSGLPAAILLSWFRVLDESLDGTNYSNEVYLVVVNGLTATNGTAADCLQEITLNFLDSFTTIETLNPLTGDVQTQALPVVNSRRQLVLNLNGGDAALVKFLDGAPFVGAQVTGPPAVATQPVSLVVTGGMNTSFSVNAVGSSPLSYRWRLNGTNLSGATASGFTRPNSQPAA